MKIFKKLKKMPIKFSRNSITPVSSKSISEIALNRSNRAKRIRFYHNGNKFFNGIVVPVSSERYRSFESLVIDLTSILTKKVNLQHGVENIYSLNGRKISSIPELEDGKGYVCTSKGETFKRVVYSEQPQEKTWQISNSKITTILDDSSGNISIPSCIKPRFIVVIRNGIKPRRIFRVFLNKRNALTMEHVFRVLTDAAHLNTGAVRKIFTKSGRLVRKLEDIFDDFGEGVFFVYGNEKYTQEDFKLSPQESNILEIQKKMTRGPIMGC